MDDESKDQRRPPSLTTWFIGRRSDVERWIEDAVQRSFNSGRAVLADEIRGLSRRVERMHMLLDQLEKMVDTPPPPNPDEDIGP
jgi:hypothetical protein